MPFLRVRQQQKIRGNTVNTAANTAIILKEFSFVFQYVQYDSLKQEGFC